MASKTVIRPIQWKKSPALTKITREINQKHWRANHHDIYLENRIFSSWRKVSAEGIFVNDSNFASWLLGLELRRRQASVHSRKPLVEPCFYGWSKRSCNDMGLVPKFR